MTHMNPMPDSAGDFSDIKKAERPCPSCLQDTLTYRVWESSCGGYEDYKYTCTSCTSCKYSYWIDGIDS